ncbi:hypothetical protein [Variovorax sp. IB41]|jgi:hypothetical protein|uniref:hypothetical protein n=1 Tax=Variovorax sp. IB41 TaxID=2779370 RepID=UPI0018E76BB5|nr:hypothetical protein [Variovorax sp. IB41]MBJ2154562.1 hypothetical protein [Variovorax sp. IB41]
MTLKKPDNLARLRHKFSVPARRGGAVEVLGRCGIITGVVGDCVRVRLIGTKRGIPFHPHEIVYLAPS